jgi:hypothetical protein
VTAASRSVEEAQVVGVPDAELVERGRGGSLPLSRPRSLPRWVRARLSAHLISWCGGQSCRI